MTADLKREPHDHGGYERTDAHAGATIRAGLYILAAMFVVAAALIPMYRLLARGETERQPEAATVIKEQPVASPFPKLVVSEPLALAEFRAQEDSMLNDYAWVEKDRGIARMPVAEAIRIVGERGQLPAFATPPATPASRVAPAVPTAGGGR
jgi:hypothetical protein